MFGFGTTAPTPPRGTKSDPGKVVGLDLSASRLQGVTVSAGRPRPLPLDASGSLDLPMALHLGGRVPAVGAAAVAVARKSPHMVCANFLPQLGQPTVWQADRVKLTPEAALAVAFDALRPAVVAESDCVELALPSYLSPAQSRSVCELAAKARLPVRGSVVAALAVVAHRAGQLTGATPPEDAGRAEWVVPLPRQADGPVSVVVIDADDFALTASLVSVESGAANVVASGAWPRAGVRLWKERLLDAMADRCVRLCRRDPRDAADAEQALYDQLELALDRVRAGQPVALTVRSAHWFQDLVHQPEEFDAFCSAVARPAAAGVSELVRAAGLPLPPVAVWLTHSAARLPGLAAAVHRTSPESTGVQALPPHAVAEAAAALALRRLSGAVGGGFLDASVPLDGPARSQSSAPKPRESRR